MALIQDLMKAKLVTVGPEDKVRAASKHMADSGVGAVLVVDGGGALCGLLSERDLLSRVVAEGLDPETTEVGSVATTDLKTVAPDTHVRDCARLIREHGIRHLPVVRDGKPAGIVSARDLLLEVVEGLESFIDRARYEQKLDEGEDPYDHVGGSYSR